MMHIPQKMIAANSLPGDYNSGMRLRHYDFDGRARFVTFGIHRQTPILDDDSFRLLVVRCLDRVRFEYDLRLVGYVIMPEHVHVVVIPPVDLPLGPVIGEIKRTSARLIHKRLVNDERISQFMVERNGRRRFVLWQRRCFDHNCRTEEAMWQRVEYCHNNPVSRKLVAEPGYWAWSSYRWYQGCKDALLAMDLEMIH
jgi:putative transposase